MYRHLQEKYGMVQRPCRCEILVSGFVWLLIVILCDEVWEFWKTVEVLLGKVGLGFELTIKNLL